MTESVPVHCLIVDTDPIGAQRLHQALQQSSQYLVRTQVTHSLEVASKYLADTLFDLIFINLTCHSLRKTCEIDTQALDHLTHQAPGVPLVGVLLNEQQANFHKVSNRGLQDYILANECSTPILERVIRYTLTSKRTTDQIFRLLHFDELTGLANRPLCYDRITQALLRVERSGHNIAVLFADLDNFRDINEALGYETGDFLLKQVAQRLLGSVRRQDTVSRFGSDEFVVVLEGLTEPQHATVIAKQILKNFEEPLFCDNQPVFLSISLGISVSRDLLTDNSTLLKQADIARYRAKELGGSNFQYFMPDLNEAAQKHVNLERALNQALSRIFNNNQN